MKYPHSTPDSDMAKEPAASPSVFTPSQLALLRMFSRDKSEEKAIEIQQVLTKHFREKADKALDALWESGDFNQQRLDELREVHVRDLIKSKYS